MINYILKRLGYGFTVLLGVVIVVFFLFNVLPGDPARMMLGQRADEASIAAINKDLGRNQPLVVQFLMYLNDLSPVSMHNPSDREHYLHLSKDKYDSYYLLTSIPGNKVIILKPPYLRRSYQTKRKVVEIIRESLAETTILAITSITIASIFGILLGIISAIYRDSILDRFSLVSAVMGMSLPSFFSGIIIQWIFGFLLAGITGFNMTGSIFTLDPFQGEVLTLKNLILPAITLGIRPLAIIVQLTRSAMLDVMNQEYIKTATAKGLSFTSVIFAHALKNALNPVITAVSGWFASLMAGAVFVEWIFGLKGIGSELVVALNKMDLPIVMGIVLVVAAIFVLINLFVDVIYGLLDPRIRISKN